MVADDLRHPPPADVRGDEQRVGERARGGARGAGGAVRGAAGAPGGAPGRDLRHAQPIRQLLLHR